MNYPLSKSEQGLYISSLSSGDAYNLANTVNLGKNVTLEQVNKAVKEVLKHILIFLLSSLLMKMETSLSTSKKKK